MVKSRYIGDGHPTFNRNPYNGYINPYDYWVDDHPLLYGNNGSLDPGTYIFNQIKAAEHWALDHPTSSCLRTGSFLPSTVVSNGTWYKSLYLVCDVHNPSYMEFLCSEKPTSNNLTWSFGWKYFQVQKGFCKKKCFGSQLETIETIVHEKNHLPSEVKG